MIKRCVVYLALLGLLSLPAHAEQKTLSLFFSPDETEEIAQIITENPQAFAYRTSKRLYLQSLIYFGNNRWSLWLQGEKWTPQTHREGIEILAVDAKSVKIQLLPPHTKVPTEVLLRPNQSYDVVSGQIIEGP